MSFTFTIELNQLALKARLGVFEWEREELREFPTNVEVIIHADESIREDDLPSTLDYAELETFLLTHAATGEWQLIERLVESLASAALDKFDRIEEITLMLNKSQALEQSNVALRYSKKRI